MTRKSVGLRAPLQKRSQATLRRVLDAAEDLLESKYFHELTVEEIVAAARVSIGSFYARFTGKDDLLAALADRYRRELEALWPESAVNSAGPASLRDRLAAIARERVRRYRARRGLLRAFAMHVRLNPATESILAPETTRAAAQRAERFILGARGQIRHPDPETAARLAMLAISAVCRERILFNDFPHARLSRVSDERLADELARMAMGYLTAAIHA